MVANSSLRMLQIASDLIQNARVLETAENTQEESYSITSGQYRTIRKIAIIVSASLAGLLLLVIISCCFKTHRCCRCCNCWPFRRSFKKFTKVHNTPDAGELTEQEFDEKVSHYVELMNRSKTQNNFTFLKAGLQHATRCTAYVKKVQPFMYDLFVDGRDFEGTYEGKGSIVCRASGPLIWFFKDYDDKKKAQQEGDFKDLVFESFYISSKGIGGKWFHKGFQAQEMNSGKWKIVDSERVPMVNTEQHLIEDIHTRNM